MSREMRFLGIGECNDLGALYLRLAASGNDVRVRVADEASRDVLVGLVCQSTTSLQEDLAWVGKDGIIVFEGVGQGQLQAQLRDQGFAVVGGSVFGDRLEIDRSYGQSVLASLGLPTAAMYEFDGFDAAITFVQSHRERFVLKFSGGGFSSTRSYVGTLADGSDMLAMLAHQRRRWTYSDVPRVVLMQHVTGVEVGVGAFFNGHDFIKPANLDWEHKRFFPGDLGELTGEMGTVVSYQHAHKLFDATLGRLTEQLRAAQHVGYVNLNMIVNAQGTWPLEFTCRFGYPGFAILGALHAEPWQTTLVRMVQRQDLTLPTQEGFAVGVVLTVPPFPYPDGYERLSKGLPISFADDLSAADRESLHFGEVAMQDGQLVTAGQIGYILVVTGRGPTINDAAESAYRVVGKVAIPNMRYRIDIGSRLASRDYLMLQQLGWVP